MAVTHSSWLTQNSQDIANNTSNVTYFGQVTTTGASYNNNTLTGSAVVNGVTYSFSTTLPQNRTTTIFAINIPALAHNADGTKTVTASYSLDTRISAGVITGTASLTLTTIPRATQPSVSPTSQAVGSAVTISTPRAASNFTHTLKYSGAGSGTIATGVAISYSWTLPTSLANNITNAASGTVIITCETYNGNTLIGTRTVNLTATIPTTSAFQPTILNISISQQNSSIQSKFGAYIQNQSALNISFSSAGAYGSTISQNRITANGQTFNANTAQTNPLTGSGSQSIGFSTTDSRGRTVTDSRTINVLAYQPPIISSFSAFRSNSAGVASDDGTYINAQMNVTITALNNLNNKNIILQYKRTSDSNWTQINVTPASGYTLNTNRIISGINVDYTYQVQLLVTDYFGSASSQIINIPTSFTLLDFHSGGKGWAAGKAAEIADSFEIAATMPLVVRSNATIDGSLQAGSITSAFSTTIFNAMKTAIFGFIYPVGCIYMSVSNTNPGTLFGGTWTAWGAGRVPVSVSTSGTFNTVEKTGGAETHTLAESEMPSHSHSVSGGYDAAASHVHGYSRGHAMIGTAASGNNTIYPITVANAGSGGAHNNLQPYITCYMWKRTA